MRLNKVEKIIVVIILVGLILGLGAWLVVSPAIGKINDAQKKVDQLRDEENNLNERLSRLDTIDGDITTERNKAKELEGGFYPDLTTYEATEIALAYVNDSNLHVTKVSVDYMSTADLVLEVLDPVDIDYDLKAFSKTAAGPDENALAAGQFVSDGKVYTVAVGALNDVKIYDGEEEVKKSSYNEDMKYAYADALCRFAMSEKTKQTVGAMTINFDVAGKYGDYLKFLDYINSRERATIIDGVVIPMAGEVKVTEQGYLPDGTYGEKVSAVEKVLEEDMDIEAVDMTLVLYCVEPMEELKSMQAGQETIRLDQ